MNGSSTFVFSSPRLAMLAGSFRRFPLAMLSAVAFAIISILRVHDVVTLPAQELVLFGCFAGFFALLATELVAEAKQWGWPRRLVSCLMVGTAVASWCYIVGGPLGLPHGLFGLALVGFCVAAPAFGGASNDELWQFNQQTFLGLAIAGIATGIFIAGAGAIMYALNTLFGLDHDGEWFFTSAILAYAVFMPAYGITFMPRLPMQLETAPMMPGPLAFVLSFVALPVLMLFGAIISAYGIGRLGLNLPPLASVGWMVMGFSACGIALHFLLYPMRKASNPLVRWFESYFFVILIPMLGLLFWAVILRVQDYGLTENRYMALLGGFWALGMALSAELRRGERGLGNAPAALALLLAIASVGPWSAENISYRSQDLRLQMALSDLNILQNGRIVEPTDRVPATWQQRSNLSNLLDFFYERRDKRMPDYMVGYGGIDLMFSNGWSDAVMRRWHLTYIDRYSRREGQESGQTESIYYSSSDALFNGQRLAPLDIRGYEWLQHFDTYQGRLGNSRGDVALPFTLGVTTRQSSLVIRMGENEATIDVLPLLPQPLEEQLRSISQPTLVKEVDVGSSHVRVEITALSLKHEGDAWLLQSASGYILVKP